MPRKPPSPRLHKPSGRAVLTLSDSQTRERRDFYLGSYGSPEASERAHLLIARWERGGARRLAPVLELARELGIFGSAVLPRTEVPGSPTIRVLVVRYMQFAKERYRKPDGTPTSSIEEARQALRVLRNLYDETPAAAFGPRKLKQLRTAMIGRGWARPTIARRVAIVRQAFKWAASEEMIPADVAQALYTVSGLRRGEGGVRDGRKIGPAPMEHVEAVLAIAPAVLAAMVRVQLATGMRPGELVIMRARDIDMGAAPGVWTYRPAAHKLQHHDHLGRVVFLGPAAQEALRPLLPPARPLGAYLFDPREAGGKAAAKATQPRYTRGAYGLAIRRLCDAAFPPPEHLRRQRIPAPGRKKTRLEPLADWRARLGEKGAAELRAWRKAHRWHPNQLRHTAATLLRRRYGLEAARVVLGHSKTSTTEIYAEKDLHAAAQIAREAG